MNGTGVEYQSYLEVVEDLVNRLGVAGLSDQEIAEVTQTIDADGLGLSRMTVWRIRTGEVRKPSARSVRLLNLALVAIGARHQQELARAKMQDMGEQ